MNTKKWVIAALECKPTLDTMTDVISTIHYRKQAEEITVDKTYTADIYGACSVPDPTPEAFVSYQDITEKEVISWLEATLDVDAIDASLDAQIETAKNPLVVTLPLPWVPEVVANIEITPIDTILDPVVIPIEPLIAPMDNTIVADAVIPN